MNLRVLSTLFLTFFSPIFLLIQSIKVSSPRVKKWLLIIFVTMYGATINLDPAFDGYRHLEYVYMYYTDISFTNYLEGLFRILTFKLNPGSQDVYKHTVSYLVGSVFNAPRLFFVIIAFIYAYFFIGSTLIVLKNFSKVQKNWLLWGFVILFLLLKNIEGINTVRTWTGMWVLVYASLRYYEEKKIRHLILMFTPPLIHVGYFAMIIPTIIFFLFRDRPYIYIALMTLSLSTNFINPPSVNQTLEQTEVGAQKAKGYTRDNVESLEVITQRKVESGARWYSAVQQGGLQKVALYILVFTFIFTRIYMKRMNALAKSLFSIGLLTITFSNVFWFNYAVSKRSFLIATLFILASVIISWLHPKTNKVFSNQNAILMVGLRLSLFIFIPYIIYNLSVLIDFPSVFLLFAPYLVWFDPSINISIKEFIRLLF